MKAPGASRGFSLVEVTIAIGIFAFAIVGILGLLPAGMRIRADSAAETRGVLISEELFASVRAATNLAAVTVRDGPGLQATNNQTINLANGDAVVIGYPSQTTVPYFLWGGKRTDVGTPESAWVEGKMPPEAMQNAIDTLARLSASRMGNGLYRVSVEIRAPAILALSNSRPISFSTLVYSP
jgi:type II secretory pathway pseudopilin PulG